MEDETLPHFDDFPRGYSRLWDQLVELERRRAQLIREATARFGPPPPDVLEIINQIDDVLQLRCMNVYTMCGANGWHLMIAGLINRSVYRPPALLT